MGRPPYHHSALFPSDYTRTSGSESVKAHIAKGVPLSKIVYGIPFYGRGNTKSKEFANYKDISESSTNVKWDDKAKVPYLMNDKEEVS